MARIRGVGEIEEGDRTNPFDKWAEYDEFYVLSDETRNVLGEMRGLGSMHLPSGIDIKVERYTLELIASQPELMDRISRMVSVGAVGFGTRDDEGQVKTIQFRSDVAEAIAPGQQIVITDSEENKEPVMISAKVESLSAAQIEELSQELLQVIALISGLAAQKLGGQMKEAEKSASDEAYVEKSSSVARGPRAKATRPSPSPRQMEETRAEEAKTIEQMNSAEFHRRERQREKREKEIKREEKFVEQDTLKQEVRKAENRTGSIKKEQKRKG